MSILKACGRRWISLFLLSLCVSNISMADDVVLSVDFNANGINLAKGESSNVVGQVGDVAVQSDPTGKYFLGSTKLTTAVNASTTENGQCFFYVKYDKDDAVGRALGNTFTIETLFRMDKVASSSAFAPGQWNPMEKLRIIGSQGDGGFSLTHHTSENVVAADGSRINKGLGTEYIYGGLTASDPWGQCNSIYSNTSLHAGLFYHVVVSIDRDTRTETIYVNGVPRVTAKLAGDGNFVYPDCGTTRREKGMFFILGGDISQEDTPTLSYFPSCVTFKYFKVYNKALDAAAVSNLYTTEDVTSFTEPEVKERMLDVQFGANGAFSDVSDYATLQKPAGAVIKTSYNEETRRYEMVRDGNANNFLKRPYYYDAAMCKALATGYSVEAYARAKPGGRPAPISPISGQQAGGGVGLEVNVNDNIRYNANLSGSTGPHPTFPYTYSTGLANAIDLPGVFSTDKYIHYMVVFDGNPDTMQVGNATARLYIDGEPMRTIRLHGNETTDLPFARWQWFAVGGDAHHSDGSTICDYPWNGDISIARIWGKPLTDADVKNLYRMARTPEAEVVTAANGCVGVCYPFAILIPQDMTAYAVTAQTATDITLTPIAQAGESVPYATPVILMGEPNTRYMLESVASDDSLMVQVESNLLKGVLTETSVNPQDIYVLNNAETGVQKATSAVLPANSVYLPANGAAEETKNLKIDSAEPKQIDRGQHAVEYATSATDASGSESIRIMTFNCPWANIQPTTWENWLIRCGEVASFVNTVKPDVIGWQEPVHESLQTLAKAMPDYTTIALPRFTTPQGTGEGENQYCAIFYNTKRLYAEHTGYYWLSLTPEVSSLDWGSNRVRMAVWGIFRDKLTNKRFLCTNTHLDHISATARVRQMEVIKQQMQKIMEQYGSMPAMLTGDFNTTTSESTYSTAQTYIYPMNDAYKVAAEKEGPTVTCGSKRIDYIMLTEEIECRKSYIHNSKLSNGVTLSDHNAHYADVIWAKTDAERGDSLVEEARQAVDATLKFVATNQKLITNAKTGDAQCQLSADMLSTTHGTDYNSVLDGDLNSYIQSQDGTPLPANEVHYLQVDLQRSDVRSFRMQYARRSDAEGKADSWQDVIIMGSHDANNWEYVTELHDMATDKTPYYTSPDIVMHEPYRYLRFNVMHTTDMRLPIAHPRYSVGEFQLYLNRTDSAASQQFYDETVKDAVQKVNMAIENVKVNNNDETRTALQAALDALNSVYIPTDLSDLIVRVQNVYNTISVGDEMGQTTQEARESLRLALAEAKAFKKINPSRAEMMSQRAALQHAYEQFMASVNSFETDKWYTLSSNAYNGYNKYEFNGHYLQTISPDTTNVLALNPVQNIHNPGSQWRVLKIDGWEEGTFALQNRAYGFYLGTVNEGNGQFNMSLEPVPYKVELMGVNSFLLTPVQSADQQNVCVAVSEDGSSLEVGNRGIYTRSSWAMAPVVEDEEIGYLEYPVAKNELRFACYPFDIAGLKTLNPTLNTYVVCEYKSPSTINLALQDSIPAGEPFVLLMGDYAEYDEDSEAMDTLKVLPMNTYDMEAKTVNGVTGVFKTTIPKGAVSVLQKNGLRLRRKPTVSPMSAYVTTSQVENTGATPVLTVRSSSVTGIQVVMPDAEAQNGPVYDLQGRKLDNVLLENLQKGIYIQNGKKVLVK